MISLNDAVSNMEMLKTFMLEHNQLMDLPSSIGKLKSLTHLDVRDSINPQQKTLTHLDVRLSTCIQRKTSHFMYDPP